MSKSVSIETLQQVLREIYIPGTVEIIADRLEPFSLINTNIIVYRDSDSDELCVQLQGHLMTYIYSKVSFNEEDFQKLSENKDKLLLFLEEKMMQVINQLVLDMMHQMFKSATTAQMTQLTKEDFINYYREQSDEDDSGS